MPINVPLGIRGTQAAPPPLLVFFIIVIIIVVYNYYARWKRDERPDPPLCSAFEVIIPLTIQIALVFGQP